MATNSRREQILVALKALLETLPSIKKVDRRQPTSPEDLRRVAGTQMPMIAMIGGVPQPKEHKSGRGPGGVDVVISDMDVALFTYFQANVDADETLSDIMDDVWAMVYSNQTLGFEFVGGMTLAPNTSVAVWEPFVAFSMVVKVNYFHTTGGI